MAGVSGVLARRDGCAEAAAAAAEDSVSSAADTATSKAAFIASAWAPSSEPSWLNRLFRHCTLDSFSLMRSQRLPQALHVHQNVLPPRAAISCIGCGHEVRGTLKLPVLGGSGRPTPTRSSRRGGRELLLEAAACVDCVSSSSKPSTCQWSKTNCRTVHSTKKRSRKKSRPQRH